MDHAASCLPAGRGRAWQVAVCGTRKRLRGDDVVAEFVRFVTVGLLSSLVYVALFVALRLWVFSGHAHRPTTVPS